RNVDKGLYGAALPHRVGMLLAMGSEQESLAVLASNAARFIDQARALRTAHPGAAFDFIAGHDTLVRIFEPRYYDGASTGAMLAALDPFFAEHRLIVTNRAGAGPDDVRAFLDQPGPREFASRVVVRELDPEPAAVSSTRARDEAARTGLPL